MNAVLYVVGFTVVFVALGTAFGIGGSAIANHRILLARIGGVFVVLFGLSMTGLVSLKFLERGWQVRANGLIKPGSPLGALLFGATFALGWSPCVGPILGSILLLASSSATAMSGAGLLLVFSAGLATPFLLIAAGYGHAAERTKALAKALPVISAVGGVFLIFLGTLMVFNRMDFWLGSVFKGLSWINYDGILDLL